MQRGTWERVGQIDGDEQRPMALFLRRPARILRENSGGGLADERQRHHADGDPLAEPKLVRVRRPLMPYTAIEHAVGRLREESRQIDGTQVRDDGWVAPRLGDRRDGARSPRTRHASLLHAVREKLREP